MADLLRQYGTLLQPGVFFLGKPIGAFFGVAQLIGQHRSFLFACSQRHPGVGQLRLYCLHVSGQVLPRYCRFLKAHHQTFPLRAQRDQFLPRAVCDLLQLHLVGGQVRKARFLLAQCGLLGRDLPVRRGEILLEPGDALLIALALPGALGEGRFLVMLELGTRLRQLAVERRSS